MEQYSKNIRNLRIKKAHCSDKLINNQFDKTEKKIELEIINTELESILNKHSLIKEEQKKKLEIPSLKKELKEDFKMNLLYNGTASISLGVIFALIALIFTNFTLASTIPGVVLAVVSFVASTAVDTILMLKKYNSLKKLDAQLDINKINGDLERLNRKLDTLKTKKYDLEYSIRFAGIKEESLKEIIAKLESYIMDFINARCAVTHKLGKEATDKEFNSVFYKDKKLEEIIKLERKIKYDN